MTPGLAGTLCQATGTRQHINWLEVFIPLPGLDELEEVLRDVERQWVVELWPQSWVQAQFFGLLVIPARVMDDIQVDFRRQREDLAADTEFLGVNENNVDIGGVAQEWVLAAQGAGQVSRDQPWVRHSAFLGGFFGDADKFRDGTFLDPLFGGLDEGIGCVGHKNSFRDQVSLRDLVSHSSKS